MTHLMVNSESDMEHSIDYTVNLAKKAKITPHLQTTLDISFSSEQMMEIFLHNLFVDFMINEIPKHCGLDLQLHVPDFEME